MRLGLGVMRIPAREFWALSLTEWRALVDGRAPRAPSLPRDAFEQLMKAHPDA